MNQFTIQIAMVLFLIILGYITGTLIERKHYISIKQRERMTMRLPAVTLKSAIPVDAEITNAVLVTGSAVISLDYFKRFLAGLYNFFGGEVKSYESLLDRARREAVLRMKEKVKGANIILNVRIETSSIGKSANDRNSVGSIEALAYGTAVSWKKIELVK